MGKRKENIWPRQRVFELLIMLPNKDCHNKIRDASMKQNRSDLFFIRISVYISYSTGREYRSEYNWYLSS